MKIEESGIGMKFHQISQSYIIDNVVSKYGLRVFSCIRLLRTVLSILSPRLSEYHIYPMAYYSKAQQKGSERFGVHPLSVVDLSMHDLYTTVVV